MRDAGSRGLKTIRRTNEGKDQGVNTTALLGAIKGLYERVRKRAWLQELDEA